ncbi:SPOR domain-containing protein [Novilysobacter erysipheiresistens]|uniref:SPOR domain-containing protein n=1 Tax=Novilysobacter erysipheiresistens TaxID=1749332 RepID=A0ABU7YX38_9GAMM
MEPALKQRLIGAAVLVAIAVIFLPMLIKGPAPESGVSDVPLELPDAPKGEFETRELPLVTPRATPGGSVTGMTGADPVEGGELATVDTRDVKNGGMMPAPTAGGDYAVSFGSYASADDAERVVVALRGSQLPGYQETAVNDGRTLYRVRIGPYASRATAETARLRAAHVRADVGSRVVVLDAAAAADDADAATASASTPTAATEPSVSEPTPLAEDKPIAPKRADAKPVANPAATKPAETEPATTVAAPKPAAADVGFAVQLGAFSGAADATAMRDRARELGFSAFVEQVRTDKGALHRVQVGPVADRAAAEQLRAQVAARMGITGFVHSHP